jgi:hypothetical protein
MRRAVKLSAPAVSANRQVGLDEYQPSSGNLTLVVHARDTKVTTATSNPLRSFVIPSFVIRIANRSRVNMASANAAVNQNAVAVGLEDLKNGMENSHVACDKMQLH